MRACDVFHVDHVDRETVQVFGGFEDAAVAQAAAFVFTQPTLGHTFFAGGFEVAVGVGVDAKVAVEPSIQRGINGAVVDLAGHRGEAAFEQGLGLFGCLR